MISDFVEVRRDGRIIPAGMTVAAMLEAGWSADIVVRARWRHDASEVAIEDGGGLLAVPVVGGHHVAAILSDGSLTIYDELGEPKHVWSHMIESQGSAWRGKFCWFEKSILAGRVNAVFEDESSALFLCEIDAVLGQVVSVSRTR